MVKWIKKSYRFVVDHLTKFLGTIGAGIMGVGAWLDPEAIGAAAQQYLGHNAYRKMGMFLFILVIFRGWYVGRKVRQLQQGQQGPPS